MTSISWIVTDALAAYRLTHFITEDRVPLGALRERVTNRHPDSLLAEWFTCPWCSGVPVAALVVAMRSLLPRAWPYAAAGLAYSAVAGLLSTWEQRD
jgi:hypothetical protein